MTRTRLGGRLRGRAGAALGSSRARVSRSRSSSGRATEVSLINEPSLREAGDVELVTWANRDPIHANELPTAVPAESAFADFSSAQDVPLFEGGPTVRALVYPVFFDDGHWYADVALPGVAASSYSLFVRLAVARFQGRVWSARTSICGCRAW